MVTDESPLEALFTPEEVEELVCGSDDWDINAMVSIGVVISLNVNNGKKDNFFVIQMTLTMFVGVVALRYQHHNGVPQLPQT